MPRTYVKVGKGRRPLVTRYYNEPDAPESAWVAQGFPGRPSGALKNAIYWCEEGAHVRALVIDRESGAVVRTITRDPSGGGWNIREGSDRPRIAILKMKGGKP